MQPPQLADASVVVVQAPPHVQINRSSTPQTCYTENGISHQEPCGQLFFGPLNRSSLMSPAGKDGIICSASTLYSHPTFFEC